MKTVYKVTLTYTINLTANGLISPDIDTQISLIGWFLNRIHKATLSFTINVIANGLILPDIDKCRIMHVVAV